jgi:hypothetical protein
LPLLLLLLKPEPQGALLLLLLLLMVVVEVAGLASLGQLQLWVAGRPAYAQQAGLPLMTICWALQRAAAAAAVGHLTSVAARAGLLRCRWCADGIGSAGLLWIEPRPARPLQLLLVLPHQHLPELRERDLARPVTG